MVITAAMVGAETTREQTPYLPITAEEIAEDAAKCREAGAAMVHLHVRTPDGKPEPGHRAVPRRDPRHSQALRRADPGVHRRRGGHERSTSAAAPLTLTGADRPDMATLTTGTVNFGDDVFWNPRPLVRDIATRIKALGLKPEIECFDAGMIDEARALEKEGFVTLPAHFDFVLGVGGALAATRRGARLHALATFPRASTWTCAAMGRHQLPFVELSAERGGNARVGLEDNIYLSKGVLAKGNYELVAEAAKRAKAKGRTLATPQQARELLRLS